MKHEQNAIIQKREDQTPVLENRKINNQIPDTPTAATKNASRLLIIAIHDDEVPE